MSIKADSFMSAMRALFVKRFGLSTETPTDYGIDNATYITGRNAAGTADVNMIRVNASNTVDVANSPQLLDTNGNEVLKTAGVSSAVNELVVTNSATGNPVQITTTGSDANVGVTINPKGSGAVTVSGDLTVTGNLGVSGATVTGTDLLDSAGNEVITLGETAVAVNEVTVTNAATGSGPTIAATGDDADIPVTLAGKGTGAVKIGQASSTGVELVADQPIRDSSANELLEFGKTASAVNHVKATNAATNGAPAVEAVGGDTHVSLKIGAKGTGRVCAQATLLGLSVASSNNTAGDLTYTAAQLLGGLYLRDCNGGNRADLVPTAADLVAALRGGGAAGSSFDFALRNTSGGANTITVTTNTGVTLSGTMTVAQNNTRLFRIVITNVGSGTEAYTVYSLGTLVH